MALVIPFLDDPTANDRRKKTFKAHERRVANVLDGRRTVASGALSMKGDVWAGDADAGQRLMVECKATEKDTVTLKLDWVDKLVHEARQASHEPVLALRYRCGGHEFDFAMIPLFRWMTLADQPAPEPDVVIVGRQTTLTYRWFNPRLQDRVPAVLYFKAAKRVASWALMPLDRLKELYASEAARQRAPLP